MVAKMCKFTDIGSKSAIYVNSALVRLAKPGPRGTDIVFDHEQSVTVAERIDIVAKSLEEAG